MEITVGLLGDVMLGRKVATSLSAEPPADLWSPELREIAGSCDLVICNLECCISERGRPTELIAGKPFFFRAPPAAVGSLDSMGVRAVSLANNHALDFGEEALADTLKYLDEGNIAVAGGGHGYGLARKGLIVTARDLNLGLLAVSDHPREYAAAEDSWGIAYADLGKGAPDWMLEELSRLRQECDLVVAFPHWGPNMTVSPAWWQRTCADEFLETGADLVVGHSAHVFHGIERKKRGDILYDLGDALDDYAIDRDLRNDLGIMVLWRPSEKPELEVVGLHLDFCHTRLATGADADWIAHRLKAACAELGTNVDRLAEQRFAIG